MFLMRNIALPLGELPEDLDDLDHLVHGGNPGVVELQRGRVPHPALDQSTRVGRTGGQRDLRDFGQRDQREKTRRIGVANLVGLNRGGDGKRGRARCLRVVTSALILSAPRASNLSVRSGQRRGPDRGGQHNGGKSFDDGNIGKHQGRNFILVRSTPRAAAVPSI
jgi:hypothetical protein